MHVEKHQITQDQLEEIVAMAKPCNLTGAYLEGANLKDANLAGVNLKDANLKGANLKSANLTGANLKGANLEGVNLKAANLEGANLKAANLKGANLEGVNLKAAYLKGVNLEGAYLYGANLKGAYLYGANLEGAKGIMSLSIPGMSSLGDILFAVNHVGCLMVKFGYFYGDREEFEQHVQNKYGTTSEQGILYAGVIQLLHVWEKLAPSM